MIRPDYEFDIPTYYQELLSLTPESNMKIFNIVAIAKSIEESTVNFLAPVVINLDNNTMVQVILDTVNYPDFFKLIKLLIILKNNALYTCKWIYGNSLSLWVKR